MPSSAISRRVVCSSSSRRALPAAARPRRRMRARSSSRGSPRQLPQPSWTFVLYDRTDSWSARATAQNGRSTSSSSAAGSSAPPPPSRPRRRGRGWRCWSGLRSGPRRGSSKGTARIYAPAAYPDESYLEMGLRAAGGLARDRGRIGEPLLFSTGVLSTGRFAERQLPLLRAAGVEAELPRPAEAERRFGIRGADRRALLHQPDAGVIRADRALSGLLQLARDAGAELAGRGRRWISWRPATSRSSSATGRGRWRPRAAIVAAGPWSGPLLAGAGIDVPLTVSRQSVAVLRARVGDIGGLPR